MDDCVLCSIADGAVEQASIAYDDGVVLAVMSRGTRAENLGHVMVLPRAHVPTLYELGDELAGPLMAALVAVSRGVKQAFAADGVTVRQNNEPAGGQSVAHLHFHVVPRFEGDGLPGWGELRHTSLDERAALAHRLRRVLAMG